MLAHRGVGVMLSGKQVPPEKSKHAVTFAEHATDPGKLAIVVGPSGKITKAVSKVRLRSPGQSHMCCATSTMRSVMPSHWSWSAPLDKHLGQLQGVLARRRLSNFATLTKGTRGDKIVTVWVHISHTAVVMRS